MPAYNCPDCNDTGEYRLDTENFDRLCTCSVGRGIAEVNARRDAYELANTSAKLLLRSEQAFAVRMDILGKHQCISFGGQYCSIWLDEPGRCEQCEKEMGR
ncbi:MAG: hypothetical protein Unbinned7865contig1001_39 [Prokaryotic dsDNA virus sp.]|nr:MAG: hypothetical protein Unbinned7865contig1001_39 [Prokaryotic dsDNA virus sp.]|tara:strand:+ start:7709 stop:8011 length:303 start_codon:yes stop_codon:yes gene_type:complete